MSRRNPREKMTGHQLLPLSLRRAVTIKKVVTSRSNNREIRAIQLSRLPPPPKRKRKKKPRTRTSIKDSSREVVSQQLDHRLLIASLADTRRKGT